MLGARRNSLLTSSPSPPPHAIAMGAVCGRESHFESLGGNGHTLGSAPPPPSAANAKKPAQAHSLASPGSRPSPGSSDAQKREAMLKAAEARSASVRPPSPSPGF